MEKPCLNDQNEYPDDAVLNRHLGASKNTWDVFMTILDENYPQIIREWRYYKDGKSWLYKVTQKKKTICWVSVCTNLFKTTFYFPERAEALLSESPLDKKYIDQFVQGKKYGKIKGITVEIRQPADLKATEILIGIKEQIK